MAISSMKKRTKMVMRAMPSAQSYEVMGPVRQGSVSAVQAGASSWIVLADVSESWGGRCVHG